MAEELRIADRPSLRSPVLISAFRGWNDGGQGASLAGGYLAKTWQAARFAEIEPENFYDFQATRPHVSLVEGQTRHIDWPENAFYHSSIPGLDRDAVLMLGIEPNLRWRTFTGMIVELARDLGVEMMITLGSLLADVPHTRPSPVTGGATDPELIERLGLQRSRYEGPTGIVGVLHDACNQANIPSVSLWAAVPSRSASGSATSSARRSTSTSSRRPRAATASRSARRSHPTRRRRRTSRSWSSGPRCWRTTRSFRPASLSPQS
jgi:proteasome assembly chaperone (PAC2) family protein